mmetsp:Transcript_31604/g.39334  ORF Transcript_31604/g.39334 Transcript_31604/m.39334 type:complete len:103 (-) Transcript_31604:2158-2466(-)
MAPVHAEVVAPHHAAYKAFGHNIHEYGRGHEVPSHHEYTKHVTTHGYDYPVRAQREYAYEGQHSVAPAPHHLTDVAHGSAYHYVKDAEHGYDHSVDAHQHGV